MNTVNWGILSTAKIGIEKVIPAIQKAKNCTVKAISSRDGEKARQAAIKLGIPLSYGSYSDLLADASIDAIYNPLPNHLHLPTTLEAMEAGKHVLCEKPIGMHAGEARQLLEASKNYPELKIMEAFMYRFHPQWEKAKSMVDAGKIGELKTVESFFSYYNDDPEDIRNKKKMGGGGLLDIGCYCISISRFLFGAEPIDVSGRWKIDPDFGTDYLASGLLNFKEGTSTFTCATQTAPCQRVHIVGTDARIVIDIPFNPPPDQETRIWYHQNGNTEEITFAAVDQYTLQTEAFTDAIINNTSVPTPLTDALNNMIVIDAFKEKASSFS